MKGKALGLVETLGYVGAIEAADVCLKAADINLIGIEKVAGGLVTIMITGDVAAVQSAIDAAEVAVKKMGNLVATHVIPRPYDDLEKIIVPCVDKNPKEFSEENQKNQILIEEASQDEEVQIRAGEAEGEEDSLLKEYSKEALENMKVVALRGLARQLEDITIEKNKIKFARKDDLIKAILDYYEGR